MYILGDNNGNICKKSTDPYAFEESSSDFEFEVPVLEQIPALLEHEPIEDPPALVVEDSLQLDVSKPENLVRTITGEIFEDPCISNKNEIKVPGQEQSSALLEHEPTEGPTRTVDDSLRLDFSKPENLVLSITEEESSDPYIFSENVSKQKNDNTKLLF